MTGEINVLSRTQLIVVEPTSSAVSVINAGPLGPSGGSGPSGVTTFLNGSGPPSPALGVIGEYYLDVTNNVLYGPKAALAPVWPVALTGTIPILSGTGVPLSTLGKNGQYYVDTAGKVIYGPRSTVSVAPESISITGTPGANGTGTEQGVRVQFSVAGVINQIRYTKRADSSALFIRAWRDDGTKITEIQDTAHNGVAGEFTVTLPVSVSVSAGEILVFSYGAPGGAIPRTTSATPVVDSVNCHFLAYRQDLNAGTFPGGTLFTVTHYLEPIFIPGGATMGFWPPIIDPRYGVRVAWENDSASFGGVTSEQTLASWALPPPGINPGGMKWVFSLHGLCSNTGAAPINLSLRAKINGTTQIGTSTISVPNGTGERLFEIEWTLLGDNDYNLNQKAKFSISGLMAPPTATDDIPTRRGYTRGNSITAPSWNEPLILSITGQWSSAATQTLDMHGYDIIYYATTPG